jgi:hypothetical protein
MANGQDDRRPHFIFENTGNAERFTSPKTGRDNADVPPRNRAQQAQTLRTQLEAAQQAQLAALTQANEPDGLGLQIEFRSFEGIELATESLARDNSGIELLNVRQSGEATMATVYVPDGKLHLFENRITAYLEERKNKHEQPNDHRKLIDAIRDIRLATVLALWTDEPEAMPATRNQVFPWEVWLPVREDRQQVLALFRELAEGVGWEPSSRVVEFPERTVLVCTGTQAQLEHSITLLSLIAELREAKTTADFFDALNVVEQGEWVDDLLGRLQHPAGESPYICVLDTGVNRGHPLLEASLAAPDMHSIEPTWPTADEHGHGTEIAGVALLGDLIEVLEGTGPVPIPARLESVKILQNDGDNEGKEYAALTGEAVGRVEVTDPDRRRIFNLAVTASDTRDRGRPTAWSAVVDGLAADWTNEGARARLFVVSAGNCRDPLAWPDHAHHLATQELEDPAQAWNALTVGAFTNKVNITEEDAGDYQPIALAGSLSPYSSSSVQWNPKRLPWKPDVVLEGGNVGKDGANFASQFASLSLLTTSHLPLVRLFTTTHATSAAAALASNMAAQLSGQYPALWPETVRALIVHSARWTPRMVEEFRVGATPTEQKRSLLRHCGYGVPDLNRALWSAADSLTLIVQDTLQPFEKTPKKVGTRDMHLHELPWPAEALLGLGDLNVSLRVTLSYFIEPNPGERGPGDKYVYHSHALRFEVRRPGETVRAFKARINRLARDEEEGTTTGSADSGWEIGDQLRRRGSIHSDVWKGSAADLADRGVLAVYPAMGWWSKRTLLQRYDRQARYALVVSIEAPEAEVDLYNVIEQLVAAEIGT